MPTIDIEVESELEETLKIPECIDLSLPEPQKLSITLPTGGSLNAFTDMSKGVPTDCALTFSLLLQVAPLLASMDCLLKILALIAPLVDIVKGLPFPPFDAIKKFIQAAIKLAPCLAVPTGAPLIPFVKDILCLILKVLGCLISQLKTVKTVMGGLSLQIQTAEAAGNTDQLAALKCSQQNANRSAQSALKAIEPIGALLSMVGPVMTLAGQDPISLPAMGSETDVESLQTVITTLSGVADAIAIVTDALGGCD
jgi:hypothetical protein